MRLKKSWQNNILWPITIALVVGVVLLFLEYRSGLFQNVNDQADNIITCPGRIIDLNTREPVHGAKITLDSPMISPVAYTDSDGVFFLTIGPIASNSVLRLRVDAAGYEPFDRFVTLSQGVILEDIRLQPLPSKTVTPGS